MAFSQSAITDLTVSPLDAELAVSWRSTAGAGAWYQVYLDRSLVWHGRATRCVVPMPHGPARVDVGTVPSSEASADLSASLPAVPGGGARVSVSWLGGSFLGDVAGFNVYLSDAPGGAVDYAARADFVAAYPGGIVHDGFGVGPFGAGGFGRSAGSYSWTSAALTAGAWSVGVKPVDSAGNEGSTHEWTVTVAGPPRPPAYDADGKRLTYQAKRRGGGSPVNGFGVGAFGAGGFGGAVAGGFGTGGFGVGPFGTGGADGNPYVTLAWQASPGA